VVDRIAQDLRYAVRLLRRNPLFALTAVLSLAVGIGANTTIFTIANALLFRAPAGVTEPDRLVDIGRSQNRQGFDTNSYPNYLDIRKRNTVFSGVYAYRIEPQPMSLGGPDGAERVFGLLATNNYFDVLGARPRAGRLFRTDDSEEPGANPIAVLSHRLWMRRFNGDPAIVGRTIVLNGHPFIVVGVAGDGFQGTSVLSPDLFVPMNMLEAAMPRTSGGSLLTSRASVWLVMGARLKPGLSIRQAQAELEVLGAMLEREFPSDNRGKGLRVLAPSPIPGQSGPVGGFMALLMGIVALVLVIACANVAGVLIARATARRREIAVRLAIGAGRARLISQLLTETTMLFALGGAAGLVLARVMTTLLVSLLPTLPFPLDVSLALDARVIAFTVALSLAAAVLSGLVPALQASKTNVLPALKDEGPAGSGRPRARNVFVVAQVALSLLLVVAAGLLVRALSHAASLDPGFDPRGVELASVDFSLGGYTEATGRAFARDLIGRVRQLPGVQSATLSRMLPLGYSRMGLGGVTIPGAPPPPGGRWSPEVEWNIVEPGYFATLRTPLLRGRDFDDRDRERAQDAVIVNETAARMFWPGLEALGRAIVQETERGQFRTLTVVGVARDAKSRSLSDPPAPYLYVPLQQQYSPRITIVARTADGRRIAGELRKLLASMDPNLPIVASQTLDDYTAIGLVPQRVAASVAGSLGLVGLLLASMGIYGVTAYMVARRTREIGIRVALGAQRGDVVRMVLRQGMTLAGVGVLIGLMLAAGASQLLATLLFGVPPIDPVTFIGSTLLFVAIGLAACLVPARRAIRINAMEALRYE
jgi:putative ABC transport system permease protein